MIGDRFPPVQWETEKLRLRLLRDSDAEDVAEACRDPQTQQFIAQMPSPYTLDDARSFLEGPAAQAWDKGKAQWAVAGLDDDRLRGVIGVPRVNREFGSAEIGYWMHPKSRGEGLTTAAVTAVSAYLFDHDVSRVELLISPANIPSRRVALRTGFTHDGLLRAALPGREGARLDAIAYSRLPGDPPGPTPRTLPDLPEGRLSDGAVTLRPLGPADVDAYMAHHDLPEVWQESVPAVPPSRAAAERLCGWAAADDWLRGRIARMLLCDAASGAVAGEITVVLGLGPPGEVMLGYGLNREFRGRGHMTRAVRLAAGWAFEAVGATRLTAGTTRHNEQSQAVLQRVGFVREGVRRRLRPGPDGELIDDVLWRLLPEEL